MSAWPSGASVLIGLKNEGDRPLEGGDQALGPIVCGRHALTEIKCLVEGIERHGTLPPLTLGSAPAICG